MKQAIGVYGKYQSDTKIEEKVKGDFQGMARPSREYFIENRGLRGIGLIISSSKLC